MLGGTPCPITENQHHDSMFGGEQIAMFVYHHQNSEARYSPDCESGAGVLRFCECCRCAFANDDGCCMVVDVLCWGFCATGSNPADAYTG